MPSLREILQSLTIGARNDFLARINELYDANPEFAIFLAVSYWGGTVGAKAVRASRSSRRSQIRDIQDLGTVKMFITSDSNRKRLFVEQNSITELNRGILEAVDTLGRGNFIGNSSEYIVDKFFSVKVTSQQIDTVGNTTTVSLATMSFDDIVVISDASSYKSISLLLRAR